MNHSLPKNYCYFITPYIYFFSPLRLGLPCQDTPWNLPRNINSPSAAPRQPLTACDLKTVVLRQ